ncbi:MAG: hypothetical protein IID40_01425, partial [Planctomycetes bacterium]|nr:hypothetical protein [Planctomycetota bacterium]
GAAQTSENARLTEVLQTLLGDVIVVPSMSKGQKDALLQALDKAIKQL